MPQQVRGVVARSKGAPVEVETIIVPDPGPGEAVVKVQACGVCHTDLHYREGGINDDFPFLLGHEAAGVVEAVGAGVTDVAPGDFVILNWRAVCGTCRACAAASPGTASPRTTPTQKMTLEDGTELSAGAGHRRVRREDAGRRRPVHEGRPVAPGGRGAARLRRHGGHRRGDQHRRRRTRRLGRRDRLRRRRRRARSPAPGSPGATTIIAVDTDDRKLAVGQGVRRHAHGQRPRARPRRGRAGAHRRQRRRRRGRRGRPPRDVQAGLLRARPRRHRRAGRRPHPGHEDRAPADRRLRPRRRPQVVLVRRLPAQPGLPDADRPVPAGTPDRWTVRVRDHRARRRRGGVREDARARCCVRSWSSDGAVDHIVTSGTFSLDGGTWEVDNNVWVVGDDRECS